MYIDEDPIRRFVQKQNLTSKDSYIQSKVVVEEALELQNAILNADEDNIKEELADVIIATMVLARIKNYHNDLTKLIAEKMQVNLKKPVRKNGGKVPKE